MQMAIDRCFFLVTINIDNTLLKISSDYSKDVSAATPSV